MIGGAKNATAKTSNPWIRLSSLHIESTHTELLTPWTRRGPINHLTTTLGNYPSARYKQNCRLIHLIQLHEVTLALDTIGLREFTKLLTLSNRTKFIRFYQQRLPTNQVKLEYHHWLTTRLPTNKLKLEYHHWLTTRLSTNKLKLEYHHWLTTRLPINQLKLESNALTNNMPTT